MDLIYGGAYQGKTDFAMEKYNLTPEDFFNCEGTAIDFTKKAVNHLERFTRACVRQGVDAVEELRKRKGEWQNTVFLCEDLSCGVVPMEAENRAWRNETGRVCQYLSREAKTVTRVFCGLGQVLK